MNNSSQDKFLLVVTSLLTFGIIIGLYSPILCLCIIIIVLIKTSKHTAGFYLLMYGGVIGGAIRSMYTFLPVYGIMLNILGFILVFDLLKRGLGKNNSSIKYLLIVYFIFFISYIYGPKLEYSTSKLILIIQNGFLFFFAYYTLDRSKTIRIKDVSILLMLTSIFLISYAMDNYEILPNSYTDFNWFRQGLQATKYSSGEDLLVDYQEVGMDATYAAALICSMKVHPKDFLLYIGLALILTLISGARQSLASFIIIIFLRFTVFNEARPFKKILLFLLSGLFLLITYYALQTSNIDAVTSTIENGDGERNIIWLMGIQMFMNNPIFGTGLGGFSTNALGHMWPHNFFLEILAELGVVGLIILSVIVFSYFKINKVDIKHYTMSNIYFFLPLLALFVRLMVSADFTVSIALFSAIFATSGLCIYNSKKNIRNGKI